MSRFLEALHSGRTLLMDGAMGTELQRAGISEGSCYELWNLEHPDKVRAIHQAYIDVGAEVLLTNTFQANPQALSRHGLSNRLQEINCAALTCARSVAGPDRFVLANIGPIAEPSSELVWETVRSLGDADAFLLETCSDGACLQLFMTLQHQQVEMCLPLLVSFAFEKTLSGQLRTHSGLTPEECARLAVVSNVAALGVNCGREIGMKQIIEIVRRYGQETALPLFARPNAGTPNKANGGLVYPQTARQMAALLPELLNLDLALVGGCCGTTPDWIRTCRVAIHEKEMRKKGENEMSI
jgi:5-methyltetrahydrofolate--homocysteine methyltransferase